MIVFFFFKILQKYYIKEKRLEKGSGREAEQVLLLSKIKAGGSQLAVDVRETPEHLVCRFRLIIKTDELEKGNLPHVPLAALK